MALAALAAIQPGGYISWWKPLLILVVLLTWAKLLTWIDKDSTTAHLHRSGVNAGTFGGMVLAYALFFFLPGFGIAFGTLMGIFVLDMGAYLLIRHQKIGLGDLKVQFNDWLAGLTGSNKPREVVAVAGQVLLMDKAGVAPEIPNSESPDRMPYDAAQTLLTSPLRYGAERIDLASGDTGTVNYMIDGVRYEGETMSRDAAAGAVNYLKRMAGLDSAERRKPQTGVFRAALDGAKREVQITTYGSAAGESLRLLVDPKKRHELRLEQLGMGEEQVEMMKKVVADPGGIVLMAVPKAQGLTSLAYAILRAHDAFLYHIHTIERGPEMDIEGITQNALPANATPAEEAKQVSWVLSQEPDVLMVTSMEDPKSAVDSAKAASDTRRIYVGMRAANTFEAIKQWRKMVGDDTLAMKNLKMVIAGRLVRRLCSACKVGYSPDPATLRKLNMNPDEVGKLYMARKEPMRDAKNNPVPCTFCHDLAFKGRIGVYETFTIDDEIRAVISAGGSENQLKQAFRKQRSKLLQEQALVQVKAGETSVEEVLRVLKENPAGGPASGPSAGPAADGAGQRPTGPAKPTGGPGPRQTGPVKPAAPAKPPAKPTGAAKPAMRPAPKPGS